MARAEPNRMHLTCENRRSWRSIDGWALTVLVDAHAIAACDSHGFMRDRTDPDAWQRARMFASQHPFHGTTTEQSLQALDEVMRSVGDTCPECDAEA